MKQIKSKDMVKKVKEMKKEGTTFEDVMFFVFMEMVEKKSAQIVMEMKNDKGEEVQMIVAIGDGEQPIQEEKEEPITNATRSMVS